MRFSPTTFAIGFTLSISPVAAIAADFTDVPDDHFAAQAVSYLKARSLIGGYEDGTFRPDQKVNRAEATKLIASSIASEIQLKEAGTASFADVDAGAWFAPYVAWAKQQGFVSGTGNGKEFLAGKTVTKAEFLKMLFLSRKTDLKAFGDVTSSLALDVTNEKEWYYPVMRYALASGVTATAKTGYLSPGRDVTRADAAVFLHRFFLAREGGRTQDLLSNAREDLERTITALEKGDVNTADITSARAVLAARGAHQFRPNEDQVRVAVKTAEGYRSLVQAYRAGMAGNLDKVVSNSTAAWKSGDQALKISPDAAELAKQLQRYAKSFADQARANMQ